MSIRQSVLLCFTVLCLFIGLEINVVKSSDYRSKHSKLKLKELESDIDAKIKHQEIIIYHYGQSLSDYSRRDSSLLNYLQLFQQMKSRVDRERDDLLSARRINNLSQPTMNLAASFKRQIRSKKEFNLNHLRNWNPTSQRKQYWGLYKKVILHEMLAILIHYSSSIVEESRAMANQKYYYIEHSLKDRAITNYDSVETELKFYINLVNNQNCKVKALIKNGESIPFVFDEYNYKVNFNNEDKPIKSLEVQLEVYNPVTGAVKVESLELKSPRP